MSNSFCSFVAFGAYTGMEAPDVSANADTAWLGIAERIAVFSSMIWIGVFGLVLRKERYGRSDSDARP